MRATVRLVGRPVVVRKATTRRAASSARANASRPPSVWKATRRCESVAATSVPKMSGAVRTPPTTTSKAERGRSRETRRPDATIAAPSLAPVTAAKSAAIASQPADMPCAPPFRRLRHRRFASSRAGVMRGGENVFGGSQILRVGHLDIPGVAGDRLDDRIGEILHARRGVRADETPARGRMIRRYHLFGLKRLRCLHADQRAALAERLQQFVPLDTRQIQRR